MPSEMTDIDLYQGLCNVYTVIIYLHSILFAKVITILERFVFYSYTNSLQVFCEIKRICK